MEKYTKEFMEKLYKNSNANKLLMIEGMNISILKNGLDYMFVDFDYQKIGFARFIDFIRYILKNTNFKLILKEPSEYRIIHKDINLPDFIDIDYMYEKPNIHSKDNYLQLLSYKSPIIKLPTNFSNFMKIVEYMIANKDEFVDISFSDLIEKFSYINDEKELNTIIYFLINTKNLLGDNLSNSLKEQNYYFSPLNLDEVFTNIKNSIKDKILSIYGKVNEEEIDKIIQLFNN